MGIRDRVYQRSLCDNVVYPAMTRSLIPANCACQSGKGTDHARQRLVKMLRRHWHHHGTEGYVLQMDIRGYYPNMRHDVAIAAFAKHLTADELAHVSAILSRQYAGDVGFEPGSQLVQIAGISALDGLDHFVKERLRVKAYVRYMDDMLVLGGTRAELERVRDEVAAYLAPMGMALHPDKTRIQRVGLPISWLGFTYRLKPTGFVRVRCRAERMRDTKRRLRRLAQAAAKGSIPKATAEDVARCAVRYLEERCSGRSQARQIEKHWERQKGELWES